ncbi:hypothetical protein M2447_002204 [Ereboglobus sp. PH5-10]|uniref:hypothetical protein n=1 Tax=Ereboglobus TaxID=2028344 RepID=UPI0012603044|nr:MULTISPECIES: hypothetical protein [Ereboglobus]MDF9828091.1 hypothetical protein [Ereboglobus sp. PH5-10]
MPKRNKYYPFPSKWTQDEWAQFCPNYTYRVINPSEFPEFLPETLTEKFNTAVVMASGSDCNQTYLFQGYRIDGSEIDEHQYIVTFDLTSGICHAGFVEHADYDGRTTEIPTGMSESMSLSGINIDYQFPRKPTQASGNISDLVSAGLIQGLANSVSVQNNERSS